MSFAKRFLVSSLVLLNLGSQVAYGQESTMTRSSLAHLSGIYVHVLEHLMAQARDYSNFYKDQRNANMQGKFRSYSDRVNGLANRVRHEVQMQLVNKVRIQNVVGNFDRIAREIERIEQEGRGLPYHESFAYMLEEAIYARGLVKDAFAKAYSDSTSGREWLCTAIDRGGEEHAAQHMALHLDRAISEQNAMQDCQELHSSCRVISCRQVY